MSRLDLVVGPNGAGKSTFVRLVLAPNRPGTVFVNADLIAHQRWPEDPEGHSYEAARAAEGARAALLAARTEFIAETVFSHPSKVDLVRTAVDADYEVSLHVVMVPVEYCILRVACRVEAGGHDVPEDKIRGRYDRLWRLVADASPLTRRTSFWDNTGRSPRLVGVSAADRWVRPAVWPTWVHPDLPALLGGIEATP